MKSRAAVRVLCPPASRGPRSLLGLSRVALALLLAAGCTAPSPRSAYDPAPPPAGPSAPAWVGEPEGWGKLDAIERWLARDFSGDQDPYWRVQGELALADGRTDFAREELEREGPSGGLWRLRAASARSGYQRVLADPGASAPQLDLARAGLARLEALNGGAATPPPPGGVLPRSSWRARDAVARRLTPATGGYSRITIHHTADLPGARFDGSLGDSVGALRLVQRNHMDNREYGDIGYHFLIDPAGRIFEGRDLSWQGAHAGGINNRNNLGICLLGNFERTQPTPAALDSLTRLLGELRTTHHIPASAVFGHRHWKSTLCPGAHLARWTEAYRRGGGASLAAARPSEASATRAPAPRPRSAAARASSGTVK